jgi:hypothetical protein
MKRATNISPVIINLSDRGDKDVAQAADKIGLQMPKWIV